MSGAARPRPPATDTYAAFVRGMNALGYTEGTNLAIEWRFASGALDQLPGFAKDLVAANVDVIVPPGTQAAQAAQQGVHLCVVKLEEAKRGIVLRPRRWVVERSFAWAARFRRLARDYERLPSSLAGLHWLAFASLMLNSFFR